MKSVSHQIQKRASVVLGLAACLVAACAQDPASTATFDRAGRAEIYGIGQYLHSDSITFDGPTGDVTMDMEDTGLGGLGFAYHFNAHLSLRGDFMFGGSSIQGDLPTELGGTIAIDQDVFLHTGRLNLDYNILNGPLTPFVTAGIGYQYLETELDRLPPVQYCWWDPWWGWICTTDDPVASETDFTWNAGVGIRWDINERLFLKVLAGGNWLQYSGARDITTQFEGVLSFGWKF